MRRGGVLVAVVLLGGCLGPVASGPASVSPWPGASSSLRNADGLFLQATVHPVRGGYLATLAVHNEGNATWSLVPGLCGYRVSAPFSAELLDPAGNTTWFWGEKAGPCDAGAALPPDGRLPPGGWANWTASSLDCPHYGICDNTWDGRLWSVSNTTDVHWHMAPPGTYAWQLSVWYGPDSTRCCLPDASAGGRSAMVELPVVVT